MDRLIIESTLADVNEIFLSASNDARLNSALVLGFKPLNTNQVIKAFSALKDIAEKEKLELMICKTMVAGIYDLEIKTDGLDEPLRITNKAINAQTLKGIEDQIERNKQIVLGSNVTKEDHWIIVHAAQIKDCELKR